MTFKYLAPWFLLLLGGLAIADSPVVSVKQIGATFLEAPPGREKNLVPFGTMGSQEKVEAHAVIQFENRLIADIPSFGDESKVNATAFLPNKTQVALGAASGSRFRKLSEDGKKTLISLTVSRLPDSAVTGVMFRGTVKIPVARALKRSTVEFKPKVGSRLAIGLGDALVQSVESDSVTLSGDDRLTGIAAIKLLKPDGTSLVGERGGLFAARWYRQDRGGVAVALQWPDLSGPDRGRRVQRTHDA